VVPYIYYIWYHYFQFAVRILVPVLIFLLVVTWKYLFYEVDMVGAGGAGLGARGINADIECRVSGDQLDILENLYRCSSNFTVPAETEVRYFLSGVIESIPANLPQNQIQDNMQKYSVLTRDIMVEFFEQLFWYSSVSIYITTVIYILFLRKTVYEL
jgi:hypothetical protein